ncbi:hypothetical protein AgCh_025569 [Apium graveolens]
MCWGGGGATTGGGGGGDRRRRDLDKIIDQEIGIKTKEEKLNSDTHWKPPPAVAAAGASMTMVVARKKKKKGGSLILTNRKYQFLLESGLTGSQDLRISGLRLSEDNIRRWISELRINEGPHKPTKLSIVVADQPAKTIPKEKIEYTAEDISSISKDAKVMHLLHSAINNVMSNRVIQCKTAKEIWDALEIRCQGTDAIKKNKRIILTQEYEHFDSKSDKSLTDLYDRFVKLLNDLSLVDKKHDIEGSNLKFLLALPECWDLKATILRDNYGHDETTLDEIYGMLKTYELKMDQRSKRNGRNSRIVALNAEEESPKVDVSKKGNGKALIIKSDSESSSSDDDDSETEYLPEVDVDEEMMKLCALMVKGITKIAYRKFRRGKKFSKKGRSPDKKGFRKSEGKGGKSNRGDYSNVKCYNCGEKGHISPDCKKGKSDKGKALVTKKKSWTDTSDSEDEENYALTANADSSSDAAELKGNRKNILVLDSGCSGHMTGNKALLLDFLKKAGPEVSYGDGNIGKTLGYGKINLGNIIIEKVDLTLGLKHNLSSISQICDRGYHVDFFEEHCEVISNSTGKVVLKGYMHGNIYEARLSTSTDGSTICLLSRASIEESWNWHKKLSHLNFININELVKKDLVRGLPKIVFSPDGLCDSCQNAKHRKSSFKSKSESSTLEPYHLLHVDLFCPTNVMSITKKKYVMVIVMSSQADEGIFVGYPFFIKAFRVYNLRTRVVMESINVSFDDKKITELEDFDDHDQLRFENEELNPDLVSSDGLSSDVVETVVITPKENAPVQEEQGEEPTTSQDSREASEPVTGSSSSDSSSSEEPNSDNSESSDSSTPENSNSISKVSESISTWEHQKMLMETAWIMGDDPVLEINFNLQGSGLKHIHLI